MEADEYFPGNLKTVTGQSSRTSASTLWSGLAADQLLRATLSDTHPQLLLSESDAATYQRIFAAQKTADWATADRLLAKLHDRRLLGHILYQRYMHPTAYKASYEELKGWLKKYADLPEADRVHALAIRRQPKGTHGPATPTAQNGLNGGLPEAAVQGSTNPTHWRAGLESWKTHNYATALGHFRALAESREATASERATGAFWAARALTRLGQPQQVSHWLKQAARYPRTFYGLIASRQLGLEADLNWSLPELTPSQLKALDRHPAGHRALALLQIGETTLAEAELRTVHPRGNDEAEEGLVALATLTGMPNLAFRVAAAVTDSDGALYDAALYPMPRWEPEDGFNVDRALIFALVRQESRFQPDARSHVGATGLMQLMPRTASYVADKMLTNVSLSNLAEPAVNLSLGQRYVSYLLERPEIDGNLFYLLAAYNSGPGQLSKWTRELNATNDPLLFIETIPAGETRNFIRRVLANYWIYQLQLNQDTPSLDAAAAGDWPQYQPQDLQPIRTALN